MLVTVGTLFCEDYAARRDSVPDLVVHDDHDGGVKFVYVMEGKALTRAQQVRRMLLSSTGSRLTLPRYGLIRSYLRARKSSTARLWKNLDRRAGRLRSASGKRRNLRWTQPPMQKRTTRTHLRKRPMWRAHTKLVK